MRYYKEYKAIEKKTVGTKKRYDNNIFTFDIADQIPTSYRYVTEDSAFNFREFFRVWTGDIDI